ncbi:hypothetical protein GCM10011309_24060 [Litorimonas cladophorae]|uniref:Outer membrane protein beta-barrel domain-containing protein n=1 Tax=Litorimonas cladophorae TaxID=1220491 RepID=A0A918NIT7_9PROT|nr:outer membrane beta-barrel protein [Litorimonas cladophorae]GGX73220.1 hypothetical protein GCM10011309_24060 [Litorimonas cladophorae]
MKRDQNIPDMILSIRSSAARPARLLRPLSKLCCSLSFAVLILGTSAQTATAQATKGEGYYIALRGYGAIEDENNLLFDNSYEIAGAVGYRLNKNWRAELEHAYRYSDIVGLNGASDTRGDSSVKTYGLHVFYDFRDGHKFRPFLGAGAGVLRREVTFEGTADNDPNFAVFADDAYTDTYANAFAGSSYELTKNLRLAAGFEYVSGRDRNIRANYRDLPGIHRSYNFFVGGRWFFAP